MYTLFVSYDLYAPGQNYAGVSEALRKLGAVRQLQQSLYMVRTPWDSSAAGNKVWAAMDQRDKLIVIHQATGRALYWGYTDAQIAAIVALSKLEPTAA